MNRGNMILLTIVLVVICTSYETAAEKIPCSTGSGIVTCNSTYQWCDTVLGQCSHCRLLCSNASRDAPAVLVGFKNTADANAEHRKRRYSSESISEDSPSPAEDTERTSIERRNTQHGTKRYNREPDDRELTENTNRGHRSKRYNGACVEECPEYYNRAIMARQLGTTTVSETATDYDYNFTTIEYNITTTEANQSLPINQTVMIALIVVIFVILLCIVCAFFLIYGCVCCC